MTNESAVVATYRSHTDASAAVDGLRRAGFDMRKLSMVGRDFHVEETPIGLYNTGGRVEFWGKLGTSVGTLGGILLGSTLFSIPVVGRAIILGPVVAAVVSALEGAAVGVCAGVLGGALSRIGVPRRRVMRYGRQVAAGKVLLVAHGTPHEVEHAKGALQRAGATSLEAHAA